MTGEGGAVRGCGFNGGSGAGVAGLSCGNRVASPPPPFCARRVARSISVSDVEDDGWGGAKAGASAGAAAAAGAAVAGVILIRCPASKKREAGGVVTSAVPAPCEAHFSIHAAHGILGTYHACGPDTHT